ncbi:Type 1 glutamine amidotransferase-like domain-containing protein [Candidatus Saccharibacteria bacterium]|nr:Type 1 glutamine amidotransferase-like domain-containing protein [Candidatus Saccharibacteria bacterium]
MLDKIKSADGVFMGGGNTFYLRYWLHKVGADKILAKEANNGLVIGGGSAGAIVLSPSLKYFDLADDPKEAPEAMWEGLNLVDFEPLVHADSQKYGYIIASIKESFNAKGVEVVSINDDQAVVVSDDKRELI